MTNLLIINYILCEYLQIEQDFQSAHSDKTNILFTKWPNLSTIFLEYMQMKEPKYTTYLDEWNVKMDTLSEGNFCVKICVKVCGVFWKKSFTNQLLSAVSMVSVFEIGLLTSGTSTCEILRSRSLATTTSVLNLWSSSIRNRMCTLGVVTLGRQQGCQNGSSA